jgi:hypothetical protein
MGRNLRTGAVTALVMFGVVETAASQSAASPRSEVQIREVTLSDGARRYAVSIMVGTTKIEAGLDTGSSGLRILPSMLDVADAATTSKHSSISYGSGAKLDGVVGEAMVKIGDLSQKIDVQLISDVSCVANKPACHANNVDLKHYGIQGDGLKGEGFKAILGINMGDVEIRTPLAALDAARWIVELPIPGSGKSGRLILNPSDAELAGYTLHKIDPVFAKAGGMHDAIPACLINIGTKQQFCAPTLLDCGAPGVEVINGLAGQPWPNGASAALAFTEGDKVKRSVTFAVGQKAQASRLTFRQNPQIRYPQIHAGILPYFAFSVAYDSATGVIGLKPRADANMQVN